MSKTKNDDHNKVALTVIRYLGLGAIIGLLMSFLLVYTAVKGDNEIDSAAVALIGQIVSIATLAFGGLGAILSSTSPKPPPQADGSTPVTVVNTPEDAVPTEPQPPVEDAVYEPPVVGAPDPKGKNR